MSLPGGGHLGEQSRSSILIVLVCLQAEPWQTGHSIGHTSHPQSIPVPVKQQKSHSKLN